MSKWSMEREGKGRAFGDETEESEGGKVKNDVA